ncbi:protein NRT1/ PTR FAMILY 3.1-like [Momordica charantia]|uniref:Protein NRT1/ PTR FAMILY 3.1-like n=1 Tax=Momordica charantia TaxID=3673 RepID=A0A6J1DGF0_MOMCH|nr:protein NRT1/ PTR FAMILY 3.1-like [Momordica charantia]
MEIESIRVGVDEKEKKKLEEEMELEEGEKKKKDRKLGGVKTMPFILGNEVCDRFASTGFHANIITYLTQDLNMPLVPASNILTNFAATSSFTSLIGALIADSFAGRFWTITVASIIYHLGMATITVSAILPQLHPTPCPTQLNCTQASGTQLMVFYLALLLTSLGAGGIRPCVVAFAMSVGHLEFMYDQSPESLRSSATALYWLAISAGNYIGTLMVYVVHKYSGEKHNWLPDRNLNRGRLEYYYWVVSGIQVLNLVYYVVCAWFYTYKPLEEERQNSDGEGDQCEDITKTA